MTDETKESIRKDLEDAVLDLIRMGMFALAKKVERALRALSDGPQPSRVDPRQLDLLQLDRR